jgi:integrase
MITNQQSDRSHRSLHRWSREEVHKLFVAGTRQLGHLGHVPAADFWCAFLGLSYDTGERTATLLALRPEWIDFDAGTLRIPGSARKPIGDNLAGDRDAVYRLSVRTVAALQRIAAERRELLFDVARPTFYAKFRELVDQAGAEIGGAA